MIRIFEVLLREVAMEMVLDGCDVDGALVRAAEGLKLAREIQQGLVMAYRGEMGGDSASLERLWRAGC
jgi:hypothetical protein